MSEHSPSQVVGVSLTTRIRRLVEHAPRLDQAVPDPVELFRAIAGEPDAWQAAVLASNAWRLLLLCCRQAGKSSVSAVLATHRALAVPGSLVLLVSPSLRQSGELFRKCLEAYSAAGRPVSADAETRLQLELANGSRIISLPGKEATIRGYSGVDLLLVDEASRVPDELMASVRPMLAVSRGRLVALSTPWGRRGHFFEAWEHGGTDWERFEVNAHQCPRISASFLEAERRALGDLAFRSEYLVEFADTEDQAFRSEDIDAALDHTIAPLWGVA
jgi:hypothetical protein